MMDTLKPLEEVAEPDGGIGTLAICADLINQLFEEQVL
jgi:hypothetical protein